MMRLIAITCLLLTLQGCAASLASYYCGKPAVDRAAYRAVMDTRTAPHRVRVECHE